MCFPHLMGFIKFNFDGFSGNPRWGGIGGVFRDHCSTVLRAFSKLPREGIAIETKIQALLKRL